MDPPPRSPPSPAPDDDRVVCSSNPDLREAVKPLSARHEDLFVILSIFSKRLQSSWSSGGNVRFREGSVSVKLLRPQPPPTPPQLQMRTLLLGTLMVLSRLDRLTAPQHHTPLPVQPGSVLVLPPRNPSNQVGTDTSRRWSPPGAGVCSLFLPSVISNVRSTSKGSGSFCDLNWNNSLKL